MSPARRSSRRIAEAFRFQVEARGATAIALCLSSLLVPSSIGCGGLGASGSGVAGPSSVRGPIAALPASAAFAVRVTVRRVRGSGIGDAFASVARETSYADEYGRWIRSCKSEPVDAFHEIVIANAGAEWLFAGELVIPPGDALRCLQETFGGSSVRFQERPALRIDRGDGAAPVFAVVQGQVLVAGHESLVAEALDLSGASRPLAACLDLGADAFLVGCGALPSASVSDAKVVARSSGGTLAAQATLTLTDASRGSALLASVAALKKATLHESKFVRDAIDSVKVDVKGVSADVRLGTSGDAVAQGGYLVALATGVRRVTWEHEARALAAEARENVTAIAEALRKKATPSPKPSAAVFPVAAPAVPAEVPRGTKVSISAEELSHPTWTLLGFTPKEPVRYQYEVVVSPDRRRATVRARGDLDGNGRTSLFEIALDAQATSVAVSPMSVLEEIE